MRLPELLQVLDEAGIRIRLQEGRLLLSGKTRGLTEDLRQSLCAYKPALLLLLPYADLIADADAGALPPDIVGLHWQGEHRDVTASQAVLHIITWIVYLTGGEAVDPAYADLMPVFLDALVILQRWYATLRARCVRLQTLGS